MSTTTTSSSPYNAIILHPTLPLGSIRPMDIYLLLGLGAIFEFLGRIIILFATKKTSTILQKEKELRLLTKKVYQKRQLGPSAFVETSKLERQLLTLEKSLSDMKEKRKSNVVTIEKYIKHLSTIITFCIFLMYYSIPIIEFDGYEVASRNGAIVVNDVTEANVAAVSFAQSFLFPIGYVGIGVKISRWGLNNPKASIGALMVFWSSQVLVRQLMDGIDVLILGKPTNSNASTTTASTSTSSMSTKKTN